ncbi:hypothetical protein JD969_04095 [Planctomycetota bacterium]|nr:hypothetical protein JD969_04095 [Planctomycetota bacterium]
MRHSIFYLFITLVALLLSSLVQLNAEPPTTSHQPIEVFDLPIPELLTFDIVELSFPTDDKDHILLFAKPSYLPFHNDQKELTIFELDNNNIRSVLSYRRTYKLREHQFWGLFNRYPLPRYHRDINKYAYAWYLNRGKNIFVRIDTPESLIFAGLESEVTPKDIFTDDPADEVGYVKRNNTFIISIYNAVDLFVPELVRRLTLHTDLDNPHIDFTEGNRLLLTFDNTPHYSLIDIPKAAIHKKIVTKEPPLSIYTINFNKPAVLYESPINPHDPKEKVSAEDFFTVFNKSAGFENTPAPFKLSALDTFFAETSDSPKSNSINQNTIPSFAVAVVPNVTAVYDPRTSYINLYNAEPPFDFLAYVDPNIINNRISTGNITSVKIESIKHRFFLVHYEYLTPMHEATKQLTFIINAPKLKHTDKPEHRPAQNEAQNNKQETTQKEEPAKVFRDVRKYSSTPGTKIFLEEEVAPAAANKPKARALEEDIEESKRIDAQRKAMDKSNILWAFETEDQIPFPIDISTSGNRVVFIYNDRLKVHYLKNVVGYNLD